MDLPQRKRIRLPHYDYRLSGAYFCTICVHKMHRHKELLANIKGDAVQSNRFGRVVENCWLDVPNHRTNVGLDSFVVMPNHVHLIVFLNALPIGEEKEGEFGGQPSGTLGLVIGAFKGEVKRQIGRLRGEPTLVWQTRFYERVVRDERELANMRRYIENNPTNWTNDRCHPNHPAFELAWRGVAPHDDI